MNATLTDMLLNSQLLQFDFWASHKRNPEFGNSGQSWQRV
jgi:hypothetical protein